TSVGERTSSAACDANRHANSTTAGWCSLDISSSRFRSGGAGRDRHAYARTLRYATGFRGEPHGSRTGTNRTAIDHPRQSGAHPGLSPVSRKRSDARRACDSGRTQGWTVRLLIAVAFLLVAAPAAHAGDYVVHSCKEEVGTPLYATT